MTFLEIKALPEEHVRYRSKKELNEFYTTKTRNGERTKH